jgi:lysophospholipid acyltransferase (LPLAT)-like uncharacterized protein
MLVKTAVTCVYVCSLVLPTDTARKLRFFLLERCFLPVVAPAVRALVWTWRVQGADPVELQRTLDAPRVILVTFHNMLLQMLRLRHVVVAPGRRPFVMLSPSLDGRLLAATLRHFDTDHVYGTIGSRGIAGAREFIRRVRDGDVGFIAADGPRGPRGIAKDGFLRLAAAAQAHVSLVTMSAPRGITFNSWDRTHLPLPFATLRLSVRVLPPPVEGDYDAALAAAQSAFADADRSPRSPTDIKT